MSLALLLKINRFIQRIEYVLPQIFGRGFPPGKLKSIHLFSICAISLLQIFHVRYHNLKHDTHSQMISNIFVQIANFLRFFLMFSICFQYLFTTEPMCVIASPNCMPEFKESSASKAFTLKDLIGDGILWAVPKHRKSIERRLKAKYGHPKYHMKIMSPKTTLRTCMQCGHDHEVGVLCRKCYFPKKTTETSYQTHMCN